MRAGFKIGGREVAPGSKEVIDLKIGTFSNHLPSTMPVWVFHGRRDGPTLFVSAAVHGDEVIGVEIIRRLIKTSAIQKLRGTLLCIPVVNTLGFVSHSRYLPDRRDLNRSFPGSADGSLAGQLANLFTTEILKRADYGIDLHSAAHQRVNLPQIRYDGDSESMLELAKAFDAPLILKAPLRESSMRETAQEMGVEMLLFESGEAMRFDELSARIGTRGIINVMRHIGMLSAKKSTKSKRIPSYSEKSKWVRAPVGGLFRGVKTVGDMVESDTALAYISDPFGMDEQTVTAGFSGIIIGRSNEPFINPGDAVFHIAQVKHPEVCEEKIASYEEEIEMDPLFYEDEII